MNFKDREVQHPNRIKLKEVRSESDGIVYDVERTEGNIINAGTPLNAATFNSLQEKLVSGQNLKTINNQNFLGQGNIQIGEIRPIGDFKTGRGEIATYGSGNTESGNRFIANLSAVFLGNRNWRISGNGRSYGTTWASNYGGFSPIKIAQILNLPNNFFSDETLQKENGKWIRWSLSGVFVRTGGINRDSSGNQLKWKTTGNSNPGADRTINTNSSGDTYPGTSTSSQGGMLEPTNLSAILGECNDNGSSFSFEANGIIFNRIYTTTGIGGWDDGIMFKNKYGENFYFDFEFIIKATMD